MKVLLDINIVLDVVLAREPWAEEAAQLLTAVEQRRVEGYVAAHTITTVHYIVAKERDRQAAATAVTDLLRVVHVVPLEAADFHQALVLGLDDFEDAVQAAAALKTGADHLITRNPQDFKGLPLSIRSAGEVIALLE